MSFKRFRTKDIVIDSNTITAPIWTGGITNLTTFFTSSTQAAGLSGDYYLKVFQTSSTNPSAESQFAISFASKTGSGSMNYNDSVEGITPTSTTYGQYQNLILADENASFNFGGNIQDNFYIINIDRNRYKEKLLPGTLTLVLSSSLGQLSITDNSNVAVNLAVNFNDPCSCSGSNGGPVTSFAFSEAGRVYQLVSGSLGTPFTGSGTDGINGFSQNNGSYGWFLPDVSLLLLNPSAISESIGIVPTLTSGTQIPTPLNNNQIIYNSLKSFRLNSQETITSEYFFVRLDNDEFNYSQNPSYISGSTGEIIFEEFIYNPQTYITAIGLYNDNNELLGVAKLSKPLTKNFTQEALLRVKLDF